MNKDDVNAILCESGFILDEEKPIQYGVQLRYTSGAIVNVFDKGSITPQGKDVARVKELLGITPAGANQRSGPAVKPGTNNKVFVVYAHDQQRRTSLDAMLRRWGLEPLILDQLPSEGQTIIEKLEKHTAECHFAVVLATPDDEGYRTQHPDEKAFRARQNVVLELGMLLSKLGRPRVAILLYQQENMERPSDIQGLIYIPFKDNLEKDAGLLLAEPPRLLRRLQLLRRWSHEHIEEVRTGSTGASGSDGAGASVRACFAVGGDRDDRGEDRLHAGDVAQLGAASRA